MDLEAQAIAIGDGDEELLEEMMEEETVPLTDEEVLAIVKEDLEAARRAKDGIDTKIQKWKELYEGKPLGNENEGRSKYVAKEAQKAVNWWIPNAMKPFMSSNDIADFAPRTFEDVGIAKSQTTLINYQFNNSFPKYQFLHTSMLCYASEGTVVARTGWIHEEGEPDIIPFEGIDEAQLAELEAQGAEIEIEDQAQVEVNGLEGIEINNIFKGVATIRKTKVSRPDAEVIKIEDFFIIGETIEDSEACIQRIDTNRSELRKQDKKYNPNGIYTNVDDIQVKSTETRESGLGQQRQYNLEDHGTIDDDIKTDKAREEITIFEYYGNIDIDQDGIAEPIVCVWSGSTIIKLGENPFPDKKPPFVGAPFMPIAFNFFGNALPHFLEDVTNVKTALTRTALDLMGNSTNGMKHVQKGSIDTLNMRRLREAKIGTVVEWLDKSGYETEIRADIPSTLMPLMEYFTAEGENESGITRYNQGLDAKSLNKTATGITAIMGQAQMRTWETVTRFAEQFMKPLFRKWIAYNQEFLDTKVAVRVAGDNYQAVGKDDIGGEFDLTVSVAIAGQEEMKSQKIVGLLQMVTPLVQGGILPPNHITKLIAELEELSGFKDLAQELTKLAEAKAQAKTEAVAGFMNLPDEAQTQLMQMAMQQMQGGEQPPQQ